MFDFLSFVQGMLTGAIIMCVYLVLAESARKWGKRRNPYAVAE